MQQPKHSINGFSDKMKKTNIDIKDTKNFPDLSTTSLIVENIKETSLNGYDQAVQITKNKDKPKTTRKPGWVYLTKFPQDFAEKHVEFEEYTKTNTPKKIIQGLVNKWQAEKEEYISVYGMEDYISVYGNYDYLSEDEEDYEDYDYVQEDFYDNDEYPYY